VSSRGVVDPLSGTQKKRRSPPGALSNPTPQGEGREHAPGGTLRRARSDSPISLPIGGREGHFGLGGPGHSIYSSATLCRHL